MNFKLTWIATLLFIALQIKAQTFDIEQTAQLIRPRLKLDSKYTFDLQTKDTSGYYTCLENSVGVTFPIKRKFSTEININLSDLRLKDIFKKKIRIRASEILGTFKVTNRQLKLGLDSLYPKSHYYANAGIIGLHLTKKYRIFYYSANVSIHEEDRTLSNIVPRFSGVIGQYHIRGIRKSFYYGLSLVQSDGLFVPAPFFGGTQPINYHFSFNYTLPVQINVQYHKKETFIVVGIKSDGYRTGIKLYNNSLRTYATRQNMNYANASVFANVRHRFSNTFQVQAECGYNFYQHLSFDAGRASSNFFPKGASMPLNNAFYANATLNIYFGKSMLEKIVEQIF